MYGDTENLEKQSTGFPAGKISQNVKIESICFDIIETKIGDSLETILITYTKDLGGDNKMEFQHRLFAVNENTSYDVEKEYQNFNTKVLHIAEQFGIDKDTFSAKTKSNSFKEFASNYVNLISNFLPSQEEFYLKLLINKAGYPIVPLYGDFLQKMSTGECYLTYSKYELKKLKEFSTDIADNDEIDAEEADTITSLEDLIS